MTSKKLNNEKLALKLKDVFAGNDIAQNFKEVGIEEIILVKNFIESAYKDGTKKREVLDYMQKRIDDDIKACEERKASSECAIEKEVEFDIANNLIVVDYDNIQPSYSEILRLSVYNSIIIVCNCDKKLKVLQGRIGRDVDTIKYIFVDTKHEQVVDMKIYKIITDANDMFDNKIIVISKDRGFNAYREVTGIDFCILEETKDIETPKYLSIDNISDIGSVSVAQKMTHIKGSKPFGETKHIIGGEDLIFNKLNGFSLEELKKYIDTNSVQNNSQIQFLKKVVNTINNANSANVQLEKKVLDLEKENMRLKQVAIEDKQKSDSIELLKKELEAKLLYIDELEEKNDTIKDMIEQNSEEYNKSLALKLGISETDILTSIQKSISKSLEAKRKDELLDIILELELDRTGVKSVLANRISEFIMSNDDNQLRAKELEDGTVHL